MTLKRLGLIILTLVAILFAGSSLLSSWQEPQFQSRLELYQTNIVLQAASWEPRDQNNANFKSLQDTLLGVQPLESTTEQYQQARKSAQANLEKAKKQLAQLQSEPPTTPTTPKPQPELPPATNTSRQLQQQQLQQSVNQLQKLIAELDLRLGILQAQQGKIETAQKTWSQLQQRSDINAEFGKVAAVLAGLRSDPPRILPSSEQLIQNNLEGWFRYIPLSQLYQLQQRQDALFNLEAVQQEAAEQALLKLAIIGTVPALTAFLGVGVLIFLVGQRLVKGKKALLAQNSDVRWSTPWDGDTILQVFVVGFFLMGQILVPLAISLLPIPRPAPNVRIQASYVLITYLLLAFGALSVLYLSIKRFFPLPEDWFRFRLQGAWFLWGLGGYCVALPIVVVVSLVNQQLWQGQGGSNPLLQLALESQDTVALGIFFFTAGIAAPIFEEILFRGFLLPSLTRYLPVWGSILASSFLFAAAHLSLSEIIPLFTLGIVLGIVYTRSRNLLAPMLLHSLWNSGTLLSLFVLGSNSQ
ncbi:CPBP family intramembrane glutamic endopeptidase [Mastigocladopsis repens]|uniref:CPBP family intramembrane glutamic endopeptidase n=1 Tax=Mastigocladopsis repens TaxID=221287 RepID=UPI00031B1D45|nr:type II CAAX endopeptidase family protein [Mastigocladopsis repens]